MDMSIVSNLTQKKNKGEVQRHKHKAIVIVDVANVIAFNTCHRSAKDSKPISADQILAWFDWDELVRNIMDILPNECNIVFARAYIPYYEQLTWSLRDMYGAVSRQLPKIFSARIEKDRDVDSVIVNDIWMNGIQTIMNASEDEHVHIVVVSGDHRFKETIDAMVLQLQNDKHIARAHIHKYVWSWKDSLSSIWNIDEDTQVHHLEMVCPNTRVPSLFFKKRKWRKKKRKH